VYGELEHYFSCPYCGEQVSMLIEVYSGNQSYIEDCEVCCKGKNDIGKEVLGAEHTLFLKFL